MGLVGENPEVARTEAEVAQAGAAVDLARSEAIPDLVVAGGITAIGAALLIDWVWAVPVAAIWAVAVVVGERRATRVIGSIGATMIVGVGLIVTSIVRTENPFPDAGWPLRFEWLHGWTLLGVILVAGASLAAPGRERNE